ncbi:MAG: hypothetical protein JXR96_14690 [Deltaproteobacteria bacterium]|nr:hypothetical protein [Deltaproteobacteria bacterium]
MRILCLALLVSFVLVGCAAMEDPGDYDGVCYDCRTVCFGCTDQVLDLCLGDCHACQGYSDCFGWLENRYDGMQLVMADWLAVDCDR